MKSEDKVSTLEQCQKLVELGVALDTERYWIKQAHGGWVLHGYDHWYRFKEKFDSLEYLPAPDIAELGELLPLYCSAGLFDKQVECWRSNSTGLWECIVDINDGSSIPNHFHIDSKTEAQARCAALIWLIENGYLNPENLK